MTDSQTATERILQPGLFVIDGARIIRWSHLSPIGVNPGADGILDALESLAPASRGPEDRG
jgi:hypothetical protein